MPWDGTWHPKTILVAIVVTVLYAFTVSFLWIAITGPSGAEPTRAENPSRTPADKVRVGGDR